MSNRFIAQWGWIPPSRVLMLNKYGWREVARTRDPSIWGKDLVYVRIAVEERLKEIGLIY